MVFWPINRSSATIENLHDQVIWVYTSIKTTIIYDAISNSKQLSQLTKLSRGKFRFQSASCRYWMMSMWDYEQNAYLQDLKVQDFSASKSTLKGIQGHV